MRIRLIACGLVCMAGLWGQYRHRFSWQDACFNNPGAPFCWGHEFAVKKQPPSKGDEHRGVPAAQAAVTPEDIDWRFADPFADALVGFNGRKLSASPLGRSLMAQLGGAETQKFLDGLGGVELVVLSIRGEKILGLLISEKKDAGTPALEPGWKIAPVTDYARLIGPAEAVDQAVERLAKEDPPAELSRMAAGLPLDSEFWAVGSAAFLGPQPMGATVRRFSLTISLPEQGVATDAMFEFNGAPNAKTFATWPMTFGGVEVKGFMMRVSTSVDDEKFAQIAASPLGRRLAGVLKSVP